MRFLLAIKIFFGTLFNADVAARVAAVLAGENENAEQQPPAAPQQPAPTKEKPAAPRRSEALTLLSALQREARFLDIVNEPLEQYSDAQIGAAARDVLRDCSSTLKRMFAFEAVAEDSEGDEVELAEGFDAARFRLTGNVGAGTPVRGTLAHAGWQASKCELPSWSGSKDATLVVAPAEVEVK